MSQRRKRIAILYPGDREARRTATPAGSRFLTVFEAFAALGARAEPVVYHDDFCDEARTELGTFDAVLVWVNPIEGARDRTVLDALLRDLASAGAFVSTHPDVILKLGTKEVLYETRHFSWGCDTHLYRSQDELVRELPVRLARGETRVLKQYRGHSGRGVWRIASTAGALPRDSLAHDALVRVRHAERGSAEEVIALHELFARCAPYFASNEGRGRIIDQAYQVRLPEGMTRCYLVHDRVEGFGHQAVNALYPAPDGAPPEAAPQPGIRLYHPPTVPEFQRLKQQLETEWVPALQRHFGLATHELPVLWDCDFLLGPKRDSGEDTYVLCEINVSSVAPFPESAAMPLARATLARLRA